MVAGGGRSYGGAELQTLRRVNDEESRALGRSLVRRPFLEALMRFAEEKQPGSAVAWGLWVALKTRGIWSRL